MKVIKENNLLNNIKEKYNEEEFKIILSFLSYKDLLDPIKKKNKEFIQEIKGYRVDKLPIKKLQDIYFNRIYNRNDLVLSKNFFMLEKELINNINEKISKDNNIEVEEIKNLNFENIIDSLLETNIKNNVDIYFKIISRKLKRDESAFLKYSLSYIISNKEKQNKYIANLENKYKNIVCELEDENKLKQKEVKILKGKCEDLEEKLKLEKKYFDVELDKQIEFNENLKIDFENKIIKVKKEIIDLKNKKEDIEEEKKELFIMNNKLIKEKRNLEEQIETLNMNKDIEYEKVLDENIKLKDINERLRKNINELENILKQEYKNKEKIYENKWKKENFKLEEEKNIKENNLKELKEIEKGLKNEISLLNSEKIDIENSINNAKEEGSILINSIEKIINKIRKNENEFKGNKLELYRKINYTNKSDIVIEELEDFIEDLSDNLEIIGIEKEYCNYVAEYIYSILASNMNILLVGYNSRKIADSISALVNSSKAEIINLPMGYSDITYIENIIQNTNSKVILFENVVDNISENVYLPILKDNKDKHLIFSVESSENLDLIPKHILNYMIVLDFEKILSFEKNEELVYSLTDEKVFNIDLEQKNRKKHIKFLNKIDSSFKLNEYLKVNLTEVIEILEKINHGKGIKYFIDFSILSLIGNNSDRIETLINDIKINEWEESLLRDLVIKELEKND